ncbi:MAG: sporulation protein [Oscillospiraceae bacterium]|nr:sporulation protein [Oscillospiraceae bacterium]
MKKAVGLAPLLLTAFCAAALLRYSGEGADAAREALTLCAASVIPSLFPFFILSSLAVSLGFARIVGRYLTRAMRTLFRVGGAGASALAIGLVGGYPSGARTVGILFREGTLTKDEAQRLLAFCNNAGPAFILGMAGVGVFGEGRVGAYLYLIHVLAALLTGILLRRMGGGEVTSCRAHAASEKPSFAAAFTDAVHSSLGAVLNVCAYVTVFIVLLRLLTLCGVLTLPVGLLSALFPPLSRNAAALVFGALEMTSGIVALTPDAQGFVCAAALIGWGGLSVHAQTLSLLPSELGARRYFLGKAMHCAISAALAHFAAGFVF